VTVNWLYIVIQTKYKLTSLLLYYQLKICLRMLTMRKINDSACVYLSHFSIQKSLLPIPTPRDRWWYSSFGALLVQYLSKCFNKSVVFYFYNSHKQTKTNCVALSPRANYTD
jgi:hypothetical protein